MAKEDLNLLQVAKDLTRYKWEPLAKQAWLDESFRHAPAFWRRLAVTHNALLPVAAKSEPMSRYDFFHDAVRRNANNLAPAFRWLDPHHGVREMSYGELGTAATTAAAAWAAAGAEPGLSVAIVLPMGPDLVIALLAALKLGLVATLLPPTGRSFLSTRLNILAPDHIVSLPLYAPLLGERAETMLPSAGTTSIDEATARHSFTYPFGSPALRAFDPTSATPAEPVEVLADDAYLWPVRDGLIALGLKPGETVCAPGINMLEAQPALLLSTLLCGGTFLHLEVEDLAKDPTLIRDQAIDVLGVTAALAELLAEQPLPSPPKWRAWFRNPAASLDQAHWQAFVETNHLEEVFALNLRWQAALGGCTLFSARRRGWAHLGCLPSAGVRWNLGMVDDPETEALGDFGLQCPIRLGAPGDAPSITTTLLTRSKNEWMIAGATVGTREGRTYLFDEVRSVVETVAAPYPCTVVPFPGTGPSGTVRIAVVLFTAGEKPPDEGAFAANLRKQLEIELSSEFNPNRIDILPLWPRRDEDGAVDHAWCAEEYVSGSLFRKARSDLFVGMGKLRKAVGG